ncbi:MAG: DUF4252 domain-containing protein [Salinivirgaceae bacterium]|nr:DUF4252 domain-containing protein [Salinivirgaceae bacterium]MDD4748012.1 DUF4252 domain-containing protein [Salinivirgaceae bacterium]
MKRTTLILAIFCLFSMTNAQSIIDETFDRYSGKEGFTTLRINPGIFKLLSMLDPNDAELKTLSKKMGKFRLVASDNAFVGFTTEIKNEIERNDYMNIMEIVESDGKINFYIRKKENIITDFVMLVAQTNEEVMISMTGKFSLDDLSKLGDSAGLNMHSSHMSQLKQINTK